MKNKWKFYIKPFDDFGNYQPDYIDVTNDIMLESLGSINQDLDNTDYDIGIFRASNFNISLRNENGYYSDVGETRSIFKYTRSNSLIKITWQIEDEGPTIGIAMSESGYLSQEMDIFTGLINDDNLSMNIKDMSVKLTVLGRESIFPKVTVPFGTISNGQLLSVVLYNVLNQPAITQLLAVNQDNIVCGLDQTIDSISSLQNKTVQEGLNNLLLASNSVLTIRNDTIYISPRAPTTDIKFTFFGQGSGRGPENIIDLNTIKNGIAKTFNFFTWSNTTYLAEDTSSTAKYGFRKKDLAVDFITDPTKIQNILQALINEFSLPKQEFIIQTPHNYKSLPINLLDKVSVDYPRVYVSTNDVPLCGTAICGSSFLPKVLWAFMIPATDYYKVIGKSYMTKDSIIQFRLRKI